MLHLDQGGAALPSARIYTPPPALAPFVEGAWLQYPVRRDGAGAGWRVVADPAAHLIVTVSGSRGGLRAAGSASGATRKEDGLPTAESARTVVVGPRTRWLDVDPRSRLWTLVVRLRPGALPRLVHAPAVELRDRSVGLSELFPAVADRVEARALEGSPASLLGELWNELEDRFHDEPDPDWRVVGLDASAGAGSRACSPGAAADRMGVPPRTLRAALRAGAGVSPGTLIRLRRLHRALLLGIRSERSWSRVAAATGFYDQAHLIRECRTFLGETPVRFVARGRGARARTGNGAAVPYKTSGRMDG